jgi:hypothetical protein
VKNDNYEKLERGAGAGLYRTWDDINPTIIAVTSPRTSLLRFLLPGLESYGYGRHSPICSFPRLPRGIHWWSSAGNVAVAVANFSVVLLPESPRISSVLDDT